VLAGREDVIVWGAGPVGKAFALELLEQDVKVRAFVDLDARKIGQVIHGAEVVAPDGLEPFRGTFAVGAVALPGAREEIRAALREAGWEEGHDFVAVA
jgi:2-polyprenyl-6-methoxyphenol hydroxylase-like FAD-dependent oxidoreductase